MVKRILVGLGGTSCTPVAIRRGVELAVAHQAQLTGVTVIDKERLEDVGPVPLGGGEAARELREHRATITRKHIEDSIRQFEAACRRAGVRYVVDQETGDSFSLMTHLARYHDLMIFGLRSIFDCGLHLDPPTVLSRLILQGVRPIVAVAEQERDRPIRRALLAYSGSMDSAKTIRQFVQMNLWGALTVRVVTFEHHADEARRLLGDISAYCAAHGLHPEVVHDPRPALEHLVAMSAEWNADLIVMSNGARGLLMRKIIGDTVQAVIRRAECTVFLSQ
jgi:nucleotide-binding universal stress UspA family protein